MTGDPGGAEPPVVDPGTLPAVDPARESATVAGVLLAAGRSRRFEAGNKLLATVDGEPLVRRAARTLLGADLACVVAVVGHEADRVRAALPGPERDATDAAGRGRLAVVGNPRYGEGQATSVRAGVRTVCGADAAVFALGDMPAVRPDAVRSLVSAYRAGAGDALAAAFEGQRGNPVLFDDEYFPALADAEGDTGGRDVLLSADRSALVETGDPGVVRDVDTAADLERIHDQE